MAKSLPKKVDGEHRWMIISAHSVSRDQLEDYPIAYLVTEHNLYNRTIGCVDCETPYPTSTPCPKGDMINAGE